jgi:hypothetical protein
MFHIHVLYPPEAEQHTTLSAKKIIIGRNSACDFVISAEGVSRRHCELRWLTYGFEVSDLGSANGVYLDDQLIKQTTKTSSSARLTLARCILKVETAHQEPLDGFTEAQRAQAQNPTTTHQELEALAPVSLVLRKIIANRPDAPASMLQRFAQSYDVGLLRILAQNPNTPPEALLMLFSYFPEQVRANPVYPLLLLEDTLLSKG